MRSIIPPNLDSLILKKCLLVLVVFIYLTTCLTFSWGQEMAVWDDETNVSEDVSVKIPVLRNDYVTGEVLLDISTLLVVKQPINGIAHVVEDATMILYQPVPDFTGTDSFSYKICNVSGVCQEGDVRVHVHAINDRPVAREDLDTVEEDQDKIIDVIGNDYDVDSPDLEAHTIHIVTDPKFGDGSVGSEGINYSPREDYYGPDMLRYAICDDQSCDTTSVRIEVISVNDVPIAIDDRDTTIANLLLVLDPLTNDNDTVDHGGLDPSSLQITDFIPKHGEVFADTSVGMFVYIPEEDYVGGDSFSYRICDLGPEPILCDTAMINIWVETASLMDAAKTGPDFSLGPPHSAEIRAGQNLRIEGDHLHQVKQMISQNRLKSGSYKYELIDEKLHFIKIGSSAP